MTNTTPSQPNKEEIPWEQDFRDFYFESGKYSGRTLGPLEYVKWIKNLLENEINQALAEQRSEILNYLESILPEHKGELSIEHNGHKSNYETVENYIEWRKFDDEDFANSNSRKKCIETDSIWVLQYYPNTPVGFNVIVGSSLSDIIDSITEGKEI